MSLLAFTLLGSLSKNLFSLRPAKKHPNRREAFIADHLVSTFLISVLYIPFLLAIEYKAALNVVVGYIITHLFVLFPLYRKGKWEALTHCFALMATIGFTSVAWTSGGINSSIVAWFLSIKVGAFWFFGRKTGYIWSIIAIIVMVAMFVSQLFGVSFTHTFPSKYHSIFSGIIHIGVLFYYFIVVNIYEMWRRESIDIITESAKERDKLFRMVIHDIKTPISVITGWSRLIKIKHKQEISDVLAKRISDIETKAFEVDDIISKFLKDGNKKPLTDTPKRELDFSSIVKDSLSSITELAHNKNIKLNISIQDNLIAYGHWVAVYQIFSNLLSNAIKFSSSGTSVDIKLERNMDETIVFAVRDQGVGLDESQVKAFESGELVGNLPTGGESSTGEGLSILHYFVNVVGAQLEVSSDGRNKGTLVKVIFKR